MTVPHNIETSKQVVWLDPRKLKDNPLNPRSITEAEVADLAEAIQRRGVQVSLIITPDHVILAGHRRKTAAIMAKLKTVPCEIRDISPTDQLFLMADENLQREDFSPWHMGKLFASLLPVVGHNQTALARKLGLRPDRIRRCLTVLNLHDDVQALYQQNRLPISATDDLAVFPPTQQIRLAHELAEQRLTGDRLGQLAKNMRAQKCDKPKPVKPVPAPVATITTAPVETAITPIDTAGLKPVQLVELAYEQYEQNDFTIHSGRLAEAARKICQGCPIDGPGAACAKCPLYVLLTRAPRPELLQKQYAGLTVKLRKKGGE